MNHYCQEFYVKRTYSGFLGFIDSILKFFTGHRLSAVDKIEVHFLYEGDVNDIDVVLSGLNILETKSIGKKLENLS